MKQLFNRHVYFDAMRQLRLMGIIFFVIMETVTVLSAVSRGMYYSPRLTSVTLDIMNINPCILGCFPVIAPLMTLYLFSFLNKRNASDFYHALPQKRATLFFSLFLAILSWILFLIVVTTLSGILFTFPLRVAYQIDYVNLLTSCLNMFAGSVLVAASIAAAMSVTGTFFTNIVVSLLIIFFPRLLLTSISRNVADMLSFISVNDYTPLFNPAYNVVTNLVFGIFFSTSQNSLTFLPGGVYTLVLGILMMVLAAYLFQQRKSEAAGQSACNRFLQASFRIALAMLCCLYPCLILAKGIANGTLDAQDDIFTCVCWYIAAILVYFIFELITTRKWKNAARSIYGLGIVAGLNIVIILSTLGARSSFLSFSPEADDIDSVSLISTDKSQYFLTKAASVQHESEEIRQIFADALQYTIKNMPNSNNSILNALNVEFHTGTVSKQRRVYLTSAQYSRVMYLMQKSPALRKALTTLDDTVTFRVQQQGNLYLDVESTALKQNLQKDLDSINFDVWYAYLYRSNNAEVTEKYNDSSITMSPLSQNSYFSLPIWLEMHTYIDFSSTYSTIQIPSFLQNTCNYLLSCQSPSIQKEIAEILADLNVSQEQINYLAIKGYNFVDNYSSIEASFDGSNLNSIQNEFQNLGKSLLPMTNKPVSPDEPFYYLTISFLDKDGIYQEYSAFIKSSTDELPVFLEPYVPYYEETYPSDKTSSSTAPAVPTGIPATTTHRIIGKTP